MKRKTLQEQYNLIKEGKGHDNSFIKDAKRQFPNFVRTSANINETIDSLKRNHIISENYVDLKPLNNPLSERKKEGYETAFAKFLEEAKAIEKKTSKEVEELQAPKKGYDYKDDKLLNNVAGEQFRQGYYTELTDEANADKTKQELIDLVIKNLDKNPSYYVEEAQFGVKGIGYTEDYPGLGKGKMVKDAGKGGGYGEATKKDFPKGEVGTGYLAEGKKPGYIAKLAEIDKQSKVVALEAKIEALAEIISTKETRISMISEDEDLAELMDKGKIKEIQKEIKILMKEKAKMEKLYEKMRGKKKEVMEEDTEVQEDLGSDDVVDLNVDNPARDAEIGMNLPQ
jgi:hypothetical protein|tara:strand:+ start:622 stop:1644 length:1023 start_codon:yes stop_codon:yes gene_type:complete